ncbi:S8 family peptidase [Salinibacillus xinjiangensis]|uniref:S8 family serine peptidase n=1 Tax=Salinibacillus xinjiangensis TaxID=1229268 RepID=A0A6G1X2S2_9BACI|nr:S8 family peptidase [Salinibacillus xinjiangensis]MRG85244.1 S8 family serine peptidase [Salinibacillus xinjiangensis]
MSQNVQLIHYHLIEQLEVANEIPKGVDLIGAPEIWKDATASDITVAILDTGCDVNHLELNENIIGGRNFTNDDQGNPDIIMDYNGHGTHVAGTIAAKQNEQGVVGVAPDAKLLILKVLGKDGSGQYDWIIDAIHYAIEQQVDIIQMSLGGPNDVSDLHDAIQQAVIQHNIPVVCAAGNEGDGKHQTDELAYPGSYNEVISVGAVDLERSSSEFSNSNNQIDLVAPGEQIISTYLEGKYAKLSGTSMAAPHVSGALALIKTLASKHFERQLSEAELYAQLIRRTVPLGHPPQTEGNGMIYLPLLGELQTIFEDVRARVQLTT